MLINDCASIDKQIGERIRKRRLMCGLSQRDLGKKLGISFQHIQGYETGEVRLIVDRLYKLAEALSVDMSYFLPKPLKICMIRPFVAM